MPPLTITSRGDAPHRARARRLRSTRCDAATDRDLERVGRRARPARSAPRAGGARRATSTRGPKGRSADGRDGRVVRVERLPRAHRAPGRDRRRARRARPLGRGQRLGPAHRRVAPGPHRARARARGVEGDADAPRSSPPASPRTSACSPRSAAAGVLVCSDELNHASIIDGCRLARADVAVYRHSDLDHLARRCCATAARRRALVVSDTVFSMDGDVADVAALVELCAREARAARARRGARGARARRSTLDADADVLRVGTLSKTLGALGGFVAGPGALRRAVENLGPAVHLHDRADARRHRGRARRAARAALARRRRARRAPARARRPAAARPPVADRARSSCGDEQARASPRPPRCSTRGCSCPRSGRRRSRRGTSRLRVTLSAAHTDEQVDRLLARARRRVRRPLARPGVTFVVVAGTGTEVGKTYVTAALAAALRARGVAVARPQARAVVRTRRRRADRRRRARRRDRRGPDAVCPRAPLAPARRWRRRWPPTRSGSTAVHDRRPRRPRSPPARRRRVVLVESAGGVRSPLADDGDTVDARRRARARARRARRRRRARHDQRSCGSSVDALAAPPRRRLPQPLRRRRRAAPRATATGSRRARASRSSPTPRPSRPSSSALLRYVRLIRSPASRSAVLPSSSVSGPTASVWPAVASYLMNWNVSPMNQSFALVFHFESGELEPDVLDARSACAPPPSPTPGRAPSRSRASSRTARRSSSRRRRCRRAGRLGLSILRHLLPCRASSPGCRVRGSAGSSSGVTLSTPSPAVPASVEEHLRHARARHVRDRLPPASLAAVERVRAREQRRRRARTRRRGSRRGSCTCVFTSAPSVS